ncbi:PTS sugar transporter subunit IIB [Caloranaerobacter azorensis]|uniref:PTS sugar transporter subunit IIB n=1 Tax=Caloranaerobacter azorensis TaxID=116090 RepID=A0A6P1YF23_9FIRM|nr:PTS sugar transporter subunit IIB [Caloranaerobacter azorensis]QIB27841.1 PTS sugar transporter subunit IIB [Caloranaerobacter azorensis]
MKKIMLVCSAGMSTSLMVEKMKEAAQNRNIEVEIFAVPEAEIKNHNDVDVILLGPQVRFLLNKLKTMMEPKGIPVAVIDSIKYGTMNGDAVLEDALRLID